ncbi:hypothetical protein K488DRAFT_83583 [Vararia minispora EC-137]|uniref:Uncharacterized protein n=1 Tax=Vararia minispora EC-137 TaxID=1314806 RepID=A0ACB8QSP0_9AGAM|nr:hypothetical protein K488DRAFT_83583 [Vararia minispora EC-137]
MPYSNLLLLQYHFPRIRSLAVRADPSFGVPVREMFKHYVPAEGAPNLEELVVEALTIGSYELPLATLCGKTPRLRRICLSPTIPAAPTLLFIDDSAVSLHLKVALPVIHTVPALQRMRCLRSFIYTRRATHSADMSVAEVSFPLPVTRLPHLRHISLHDIPCSEAIDLLLNLDVPHLTSATVHVTSNPRDRDDIFGDQLVSAMKHVGQSLSSHAFATTERTVVLSTFASASALQILSYPEPAVLPGNVPIHIIDESSRLPVVWNACPALIEDGIIRALRLEDCATSLNSRQWHHYLCLPVFDGVETVEFLQCSQQSLPDAFLDAASASEVLPSLKQVIITDQRGRDGGADLDFSLLIPLFDGRCGAGVHRTFTMHLRNFSFGMQLDALISVFGGRVNFTVNGQAVKSVIGAVNLV